MGKGFEQSNNLDASGMTFAIVVSRFNEELTSQLANDALQCLKKNGADVAAIGTFQVPGAYEIPVVANQLAASGKYDALIVLGVVVEGETQHAQMIIDTTGRTILDISCRYNLPVINEIVGVRTWEQAVARCSSSEESRGWYAAEAAIETAKLMKAIKESK
ncbi:6,7-dimethyl-8-ribityllumazine synthase [Tichowtungia aerotolerans]|uniref:6,7-dimethyl-8-ribityllumazine synthase n=1 Tax=Tichowtungia aerotolerans TaxID=2697043 RepID=A0A6P1M676_9BACT|nr:6,7-dimethyl-8-ribityllumazine synthase [Tichowtungia aerotolerans]QHI70309.1 6,7-dimethyl-8-ribityllumazine synthase [Tichowtungia aerotolerans]